MYNCPLCFSEINEYPVYNYYIIEFIEPLDARKESYHSTKFSVCEECFKKAKKFLNEEQIKIYSENYIQVFSETVVELGSFLDSYFDERPISVLNLLALITGQIAEKQKKEYDNEN